LQIGLLSSEFPTLWEQIDDDAGRGLFSGTETMLTKTVTKIEDVGAFIFCEGPGSMLGTRTVAMALRTWLTLKSRPVFAYQSLALAALAEWKRSPRAFAVVADARRESWHRQPIDTDGSLGLLERYPTADLPAGNLFTPAGFRVWSKPPAHLAECPYAIDAFFACVNDADLFRRVETPNVLQQDAPNYKKWSAQPHSAETAIRQ
jgi:tRNA threonylcarbamoyladenosine biosynthesis protein TsaB